MSRCPNRRRLVDRATLKIADARNVYVARTYAYVAGGAQGVVIVDVERPEQPRIDQVFNAGGALNDVNDVKVAMTNASVFAYVADGGTACACCSWYRRTRRPARSGSVRGRRRRSSPATRRAVRRWRLSKGLDRDRAVDESGNQVAVFGRRGGRPFNLEEMRRMYLRDGAVWTVTDQPPGPAVTPRPATLDRSDRPVVPRDHRLWKRGTTVSDTPGKLNATDR